MLNIILAHTPKFGIAFKNKIPWNIPHDLGYFQEVTSKRLPNIDVPNVLIMGRLTADTLKRPLKDRVNLVLTSNGDYRKDEGFIPKSSLLDALEYSFLEHRKSPIFVIGGSHVVTETLKYPNLIDKIYLTYICHEYECDVFVNDLKEFVESNSDVVKFEAHETHNYLVYQNRRPQSSEQDYLNILHRLLQSPGRQTRNAVTRSLFSTPLTFDLQEGFPLLTTKRVFWKGIVNELLSFLGGCTDNSWLKSRGVHIWDKNTTEEFIRNLGLPYPEDTLGPMYSHQFRYYGAEYKGKDVDYTGQGKDQFAEVIDLLLNDPHSRRILMTSYNYDQVKLGVLYPCHSLVLQFYVEEQIVEGEKVRYVSMQCYIRSNDIICGAPFNIASNALLVHIVVNILNQQSRIKYDVGRLHIILGDYHLYENHIRQAIIQMGRVPRVYPKLEIKNNIESINPKYFLSLDHFNFELIDYQPYPAIKAEMVA